MEVIEPTAENVPYVPPLSDTALTVGITPEAFTRDSLAKQEFAATNEIDFNQVDGSWDTVKQTTAGQEAYRAVENLALIYPALEATHAFIANGVALPIAGIAGILSYNSPGGDVESATKMIGIVQEFLATPPTPYSPRGTELIQSLFYPFIKLQELGAKAGEATQEFASKFELTKGPVTSSILATVANTAVEVGPLFLISPAVRGIKNSNAYRSATIKERGVVLKIAETIKEANPNMTDGQLARRSQFHFEILRDERIKVEEIKAKQAKEPAKKAPFKEKVEEVKVEVIEDQRPVEEVVEKPLFEIKN